MRQSGKTTRLIDDAIQALFTDGEIFIPFKSQIIAKEYTRGVKCKIFIDEDFAISRAQEDFKRRLIRRLDIEHSNQFYITEKGNFIKLYYRETKA